MGYYKTTGYKGPEKLLDYQNIRRRRGTVCLANSTGTHLQLEVGQRLEANFG